MFYLILFNVFLFLILILYNIQLKNFNFSLYVSFIRRHGPHPNICKYIMLKRDLDEETMIAASQEINQRRPTKIQRKTYHDHDTRLVEAKGLLQNKEISLSEYQRRIRFITYKYIESNEKNRDDSNIDNEDD